MPDDRAAALSAATAPENGQGSASLLLVLASALSYMSIACWSVILPGWVLHHLHGSSAEVGWVTGLSAVCALLLRSLAGGLGDRLGRRGPALGGAALMALGSLILLLPASLLVLVISRVLLGGADALFATAVMAWAVEGVAPERHGRTLASVGMGIWLGTALAPLWATFAREHGGYSAVWLGAGVIAVLAGVAVALMPASAGALISDGSASAPDGPAPMGGADSPELLARIPRGALIPAVVMLCASYGDGVFQGFGIVHLTANGISSGAAASVFTIIAVTTLLGRFAGGTLADRSSPRRLGAVAIVLLAGGYSVMAAAASLPVAGLGGVLIGSGLALAYPALGVLVSTQVPPERRGAGFGFFLASLDIAFGLGPALGGLIVSASSTTVALLSGSAVSLLGLPLLSASAARFARRDTAQSRR